jgi:hypothetical protein
MISSRRLPLPSRAGIRQSFWLRFCGMGFHSRRGTVLTRLLTTTCSIVAAQKNSHLLRFDKWSGGHVDLDDLGRDQHVNVISSHGSSYGLEQLAQGDSRAGGDMSESSFSNATIHRGRLSAEKPTHKGVAAFRQATQS